MKSRYISLLLASAISLWVSVAPLGVQAAGVVGNGTPGSCTEAAFTSVLAGGGNISFNCGPTLHTIAITSSKRIAGTTTIDGGGRINLSGGNTVRVFYVPNGATLNLANITLRDSGTTEFTSGSTLQNDGTANLTNVAFINNNWRSILNGGGALSITASRFEDNTTSGGGAAISNESGGTLTVRNSTFVNNRAPDSQAGGAIYNSTSGTIAISRSIFMANAAGGGGAIINFGTMAITDSTLSGNTANDGGGAIQARTGAALTIVNTTISGNAARRGGGIYAVGSTPGNAATLTNATIASNTAPADATNQGGGNLTVGGEATVTLRNTIVANPGGSASNCKKDSTGTATIIDSGANLQFPGTTCGGSITNGNPSLGLLDDNGGLTPTHALAPNSPARNAGNNANCPTFDQRGVVRPQGGTCDIGALEYGAIPILTSANIPCAPREQSFTIMVTGSNFIAGAKGSRIIINGTSVPTTLINQTQLRAVVPAGLVTGASGATIPAAVQTPVVDGGISASLPVTICYSVQLPTVAR